HRLLTPALSGPRPAAAIFLSRTAGCRVRCNAKRQPKLPFSLGPLARRSRRRLVLASVALAEFLHPARRIDDLLFARVEGMAGGAHFDVQRLVDRRARREGVTAAARNLNLAVLRVDTGFHRSTCAVGRARPRCLLVRMDPGGGPN